VAVRLRALAPGKVNLSLFLGSVRAQDARHRLVTLYESVSLADELTLETLAGASDEVRCPGVSGRNLVADALEGLRARGWGAPAVRITIDKRIPVAAGMGGGSADAAAALRLAAALGGVDPDWLAPLAVSLGADVPAQLRPGLALGTGAGELVEPVAELAEHALVIVPLEGQGLSTAAVYREADRIGLTRSEPELGEREAALRAALAAGERLPADLLVNDLEPAAAALCPAVSGALRALREAGAEPALVCGSGPTCAGIWWEAGARERARRASAALRAQWPAASAVEPVSPGIGNPADAPAWGGETLRQTVG
jgi:4-diphosphocytidyl-2-C-methyl-D-erythritol kinase